MTIAPTPLRRRRAHGHRPVVLVAVAAAVALVAAGVTLLLHYDVFQSSSESTAAQGSGVAAAQTRTVSPFSSVELAGTSNVTILVGGKQLVVVRGDDNLLGHVTTDVRDGRLVVGTRGSFTTASPMSVEIAVPTLAALALSGSGTVTADDVRAQSLIVTLTGSGLLRAGGTANRLDVSLAGSGDAQLDQLVARDVHAVLSGSGRIVVHATSKLDASVPGTGTILYSGSPAKVTTNISGQGAITRK
jgi:putative autotransporter adhesin-like protein